MSTQPIIIQVTDQVDPNIAAKIAGIGTAAQQAATNLQNLQAQLNSVTAGTTQLNQVINNVTPGMNNAGASTGRLTGALAQLLGRIVGAEAGFGMLGGAMSRVGVAAGLAGPLIIAALAVGAVVGAILVYEKFEEAARKLVTAQTDLETHIASQNDKLLTLNETYIRLTQGPLAAYKQELLDLPHRSIITDIDAINKVLEAQKSHWNDLVSFVERYSEVVATLAHGGIPTLTSVGPKFDVQNAIDFENQIAHLEATASAAHNGLQGLHEALSLTGQKLIELHNIEQGETGKTLEVTEKARQGIQELYNAELRDLADYNAKKKNLVAGANGDLLTEQRKAAADQLKEFNDELNQLKQAAGVITPQQVLDLRQKQLSGDLTGRNPTTELGKQPALPLNVDTLNRDIGNAQEAIDRQNAALARLVEKYHDASVAGGAYSDKLKEENEYRRANLELLRLNIPLSEAVTKPIYDAINASVESAKIDEQKIGIYERFQKPLQEYNAALQASAALLKDGAISSEQAAVADAAALRTKQDAIDPLNQYNIGLEHEVALLGYYGTTLTAATEVDRVRQQLQAQGYDLNKTQISALTTYLTLLERQKEIQSALNTLWEQNAGTVQKLVSQQLALNKAVGAGVISETQYKIATAQNNIALADQINIESKQATIQSALVAGIGKYLQGYQGLAKGVSDAYGQAFATIADGAANSLGRALAYGEDLGKALQDVARQAVSELISAFIKLGIQWVITEALGKTLGTSAAISAAAQATTVGAAWAPAAAFASLATLGANAAPAAAAVSGTVALSEALNLVHFAQGGYVSGSGSGTSDSILAALSNGEYVVNAKATAQNRALLDSINSGANAVRANSVSSGNTNGTQLKVNVIHDGSTAVSVTQVDEYTVHVIAKQEARNAVHTLSPAIIAADIENPNSRTSKAINRNINAQRKR